MAQRFLRNLAASGTSMATAVVSGAAALLIAAAALLFVWAMIALAFIDLDTFYLPDDITLPLLWLGLLLNIGGVFAALDSAVLGAVAGYLALWLGFEEFELSKVRDGFGVNFR